MKILYYSPASYGGLADYAHEQANALVQLGIDVTLLCTPGYPTGRGEQYKVEPVLQEIKSGNAYSNKLLKAFHYISAILSNYQKLAHYIKAHNIHTVLLGSYAEYLAPLWSGQFRKLAQTGVVFGAIVHDPVRDFVLGPRWWHRWSIASSYSFLREAFVHYPIQLDTGQPLPQLRTTVIPHGNYQFPIAAATREATRQHLQLPQDAKVMLAFGHIRDNKNLDLVIQAMPHFPNVYLIVAGKEQSSGQKPIEFYQNLATRIGVAERCRWKNQLIPEQEVANLFEASDIVVLTYNSTFHSASGVLNTAVSYRKPCLASSGEGVLKAVVQKYGLGVWICPDNATEVLYGIKELLNNQPAPQWEQYLLDNSWQSNAQLVKHYLMSRG